MRQYCRKTFQQTLAKNALPVFDIQLIIPKIITANTAIDLFIEVKGLTANANILVKSSIDFACGKKINVAKAIESLDNLVSCLGFVGRQSLAAFNALNTGLLQLYLTVVAGKTRTNTMSGLSPR